MNYIYAMMSLFLMTSCALSQCTSQIYCQGEILHTVQSLKIFPDSKTYVDLPKKYSDQEIIGNFQKIDKSSVEAVKAFLNDNFNLVGSDLEQVTPLDWVANPVFLDKITNNELKQWASEIHALWKQLSRKFIGESSAIHVPEPFFVPGGRFREFYYWDSLWIVDGLLVSGMIQSAKNIQKNFIHMIQEYGYIPNGARIYYEGRSQPPVTAMITERILKQIPEDEQLQLIKDSFAALEKEYEFFVRERSFRACDIFPGTYCDLQLFHYDSPQTFPRPESYREDVELAKHSKNAKNLFRELAAGAETGWDYSSRWFKTSFDTIRASKIIPIDLNVFMVINLQILSKYAAKLKLTNESIRYKILAQQTKSILVKYFYNDEMSQFNDYLTDEKKLHAEFYPSNFFMLLLDIDQADMIDQLEKIIDKFQGGIPTSLLKTGQQWDLPNSWPPLNQLLILGLQDKRPDLALKLAQKYITNSYCSYQQAIKDYGQGYMFEKYSAESIGSGGGGEYEIQSGFGWTNGVALGILNQYGNQLQIQC